MPRKNHHAAVMTGPEFLLLYVLLIAAAVLLTRWFNRWRDPRRGEDLPAVPSPADPYELAWLRGGAPEAVRLAVFDLIQSGNLESSRTGRRRETSLVATPISEPAALAPLARTVLRACATPRKPVDLMRGALAEGVDVACAHWRLAHEEAGLLVSSHQRAQGWWLVVGCVLVLVGITVARVDHAFAHGHSNVGFLIALTIVAMVLVPWLGRPAARLTARGISHLQRLRAALAPSPVPVRRPRPAAAPATVGEGSSDVPASAWSPLAAASLLPIALYGMDALSASERDEMRQLFPQAATQPGTSADGGSGSACGSVESTSSSSGGGDSGGDSGGGDSGDSGGGGGCGGGGD